MFDWQAMCRSSVPQTKLKYTLSYVLVKTSVSQGNAGYLRPLTSDLNLKNDLETTPSVCVSVCLLFDVFKSDFSGVVRDTDNCELSIGENIGENIGERSINYFFIKLNVFIICLYSEFKKCLHKLYV